MSRERDLVKNTFIISFGTFLPKLASIITLPIITAGLTKQEYGTYDLINTLIALIMPIVTLQIQAAAFRFLIEARKDEAESKRIISTIMTFICVVAFVCSSVLFFALQKIPNDIKAIICIYYFLDTIVLALLQVMRGLNKNRIYSSATVMQSMVNMLLIVALIQCYHKGLRGVLLSAMSACLCSALFMIIYGKLYKYYNIRNFSRQKLIEMLSYSWPLVPNSLSLWVMNISDRLIVTAFLGIEVNAVYAVANKIPSLFGIVQNTFTYAWQENASVNANDEDVTSYYSSVFDRVFSLLVGAMAVLIAMTPILFWVLIKGDYGEAYNQMPILFLGIFFSTISSFLGGVYVARKQTKSVGFTTFLSAMVNFLLNLIFVNKIGIYAASLSTVISFALLVLYRMIDIQKFQKILFDKKKIVLSVMMLCMMCVMCSFRNIFFNILNGFLAVVIFAKYNEKLIRSVFGKIRGKGK